MSAPKTRRITRRGFLKGIKTGGTALAASWLLDGGLHSTWAEGTPAGQSWGVLVDLTRCGGCGSCSLACAQSNGLPLTEAVPDTLDCSAYTCLQVHELTAADKSPETIYVKRQCMHCVHPACVSACTVRALRKMPEGPVVYDAVKCIGCRYCQYACPFGVPTYDWGDPFGLIHKCQFCFSRLSQGHGPACVEACPNGALRFDRRDALLAQAHAQIETNPGRYVDHVYGEQEVGGTSMLYISPVDFSEIGFPLLGDESIAHNADKVMQSTPIIAVTVASAITGAHLFLRRRERMLSSAPASEGDPGVAK